jgi:type IV pilus assembly protein PilZ
MASKKDRHAAQEPKQEERMTPGAERRQFERVLVDLEVDYGAEDTFLFAYITDISAMGIFVLTNNPEPAGTRLNLRFSPPGWNLPLELEGIVIWINPYRPGDRENLNPGMGIQFVDLAPEQREQLTHLVKTFAYLDEDEEDGDPDDSDDEDTGSTTGRA